ncbi:site-specific DNA-methyltransferase [Mycobacterium lehmannii]|uniref:site-specific DNA-methyltransferase n=1 Tax=Mycobacterium lehmannii TaxID=2048550 RepID=UPI000B93C9AA|nr:DNA methyltransferase [Mycobacterium lehmannii]
MSRLTELIRQAKLNDPQLGTDLEREFKVLSGRRAFGLNFERHRPETVELPHRPVRRGDKVRVLPSRRSTTRADQRLWLVKRIEKTNDDRVAHLELVGVPERRRCEAAVNDLVVVAAFRDLIYPGLESTGKVERGGDKPFHTVINAENYLALKALTYTHRGSVDAIYIDPPFNTGARDWKYNNDYVESDDHYRHSKWLAFMERRLLLAKELLNPENSVLIVTIDEKEYLRLGLILEQTFADARITMVTSAVASSGTRRGTFGRAAEFIYFVQFGTSRPIALQLDGDWNPVKTKNKTDVRWCLLLRSGTNALRADRPNQFYPVFARGTADGPVFAGVGTPYYGSDTSSIQAPSGCVAIWPIRRSGEEGRWQVSHDQFAKLIDGGFARLGPWRGPDTSVYYLKDGERKKVADGTFQTVGRRADGSVVTDASDYTARFVPTDIWRITSHDAGNGGSRLIERFIPGRKFPFPKSLYAVEDALRFFVADKPEAIVLDYFAGSGTTAHAVMRLNRQDGGRRQTILVTNNEVSADEQTSLRRQGLRPGDRDWEQRGICEYITKPRIDAAITGVTPEGDRISGDYRFTDEFPMAEGFEENAEFFTLTFESAVRVSHNRAFSRIAPLLWMRSGSVGERIEAISDQGWAVADSYGILFDLDQTSAFCREVEKADRLRIAYLVTDDDRRFQAVAQRLPDAVEPVQLYESYLSNFRFANGD